MRARRALGALTVAALAGLAPACGDDDEAAADDAFPTLDRSGDSYLDVDEVAEWVDDEGVFAAWDVDADSELDGDEVAGNAFGLWDADGNGLITEDEWRTGSETLLPDADPVPLNDWDGDGDSELDLDEFSEEFDASILGESWASDPLDEETFASAYFELYDADADGKVSAGEWEIGSSRFGTSMEP